MLKATIQEDANGLYLEIPEEVTKALKLRAGDRLKCLGNKKVMICKKYKIKIRRIHRRNLLQVKDRRGSAL